jgi:hypothetical protein
MNLATLEMTRLAPSEDFTAVDLASSVLAHLHQSVVVLDERN